MSVSQRTLDAINNGPYKCRLVGACGDIYDSRTDRYMGSLLQNDALDVVQQLNQRYRWFIQDHVVT